MRIIAFSPSSLITVPVSGMPGFMTHHRANCKHRQ
jgi:hypothetical protein